MRESGRFEDDDEDYDEENERERRRRRRRLEEDDDVNMGDDAGMRLILPVGRSGWAIAAGYLALFSVLCVPAPFALLAGILAIIEIRNNPKKHGMGRAVFGIVMGVIGTVFLALFLVALIAKLLGRG